MNNKPMPLFKSPVSVHNVHHFQYEGGPIQQTGSSDCAGPARTHTLLPLIVNPDHYIAIHQVFHHLHVHWRALRRSQ